MQAPDISRHDLGSHAQLQEGQMENICQVKEWFSQKGKGCFFLQCLNLCHDVIALRLEEIAEHFCQIENNLYRSKNLFIILPQQLMSGNKKRVSARLLWRMFYHMVSNVSNCGNCAPRFKNFFQIICGFILNLTTNLVAHWKFCGDLCSTFCPYQTLLMIWY